MDVAHTPTPVPTIRAGPSVAPSINPPVAPIIDRTPKLIALLEKSSDGGAQNNPPTPPIPPKRNALASGFCQ